MNVKEKFWRVSVVIGFLSVARFNQFLIESIFQQNLVFSAISIFLLSCLLPVIFWISGNFRELEEKLNKENVDAERESLTRILPYFWSFIMLLSIIKILSLVDLGALFNTKEVRNAMIGLNYGSIIAIIIYTLKTEFEDEKVDKIYSYRKKIEKL